MKKTPNYITNIIGFITLVFSFHYFLSYKWLKGKFAIYGLDDLPLISIDDVTFSFAHINFLLIKLALIGFVLILLIKLFLSNEIWKNFDTNVVGQFKQNWKLMGIKLRIGLLMIFIFFLLWIGFEILRENELSIPLKISSFFITYGLPFTYVFWVKKRNLILGIYFVSIVIWTNATVDYSLNIFRWSENSRNKNTAALNFTFQGEDVEVSDSLQLIFHGYKYLILKEVTGNFRLYPTKDIGMICYNKVAED